MRERQDFLWATPIVVQRDEISQFDQAGSLDLTGRFHWAKDAMKAKQNVLWEPVVVASPHVASWVEHDQGSDSDSKEKILLVPVLAALVPEMDQQNSLLALVLTAWALEVDQPPCTCPNCLGS